MNNNIIINDIRQNFNNITFSNYQKSKTKKELIKCIYNNKLENAIYWSAELICSGFYLELWDIIILYFSKFIHRSNNKICIYLNMRYENFINILNNGYSNDILELRNNIEIRNLFCEIICILCNTMKSNEIQCIKLNKTDDFELSNIHSKFNAPTIEYAESIYKNEDPKELFIPINELIYNLEKKNIIDVLYWLEWIYEYENRLNKKKIKCLASSRDYAPENNKNDIIWIIWDIIFYYVNNKIQNNSEKRIKKKIVDSSFKLFIIKYGISAKKKRKPLLYYIFNLLLDDTSNIQDKNILSKDGNIENVLSNINLIYKEIKKNEICDNSYNILNNKNNNLNKSIEKFNLINKINLNKNL
tara:strand:+ start:119 stop:1192 length:1074 start_codon:yes stop_codon:yes gene_type:complete